ncbi:hypothetical protein [Paenibacillus sp. Mc5Re-14]|uniref:hypothetical protein n=1 Tax=Paenibacillus sp. Mc5Re-14 TaxID=1030529 RepID=UPI000AA0A673|nr:hypothetical protein [Paenibacillus sp. Mc5Re-14]
MKLKLTEEQRKSILLEKDIEGFDYESVEQSDWEDQGKFQSCEVIFKHEGKYYAFYAYRHGSYWSSYEIDFYDDDVTEVTKEAYTSYRWVQVKAEENPPESVSCYSEE